MLDTNRLPLPSGSWSASDVALAWAAAVLVVTLVIWMFWMAMREKDDDLAD